MVRGRQPVLERARGDDRCHVRVAGLALRLLVRRLHQLAEAVLPLARVSPHWSCLSFGWAAATLAAAWTTGNATPRPRVGKAGYALHPTPKHTSRHRSGRASRFLIGNLLFERGTVHYRPQRKDHKQQPHTK